MKNVVLTLLLAAVVVLTALSVRQFVVGNGTNVCARLVAIGSSPLPMPVPQGGKAHQAR